MKTCTKCGEDLPATNEFFGKTKNSKDGLNWWCKKCHREYWKNHKEERNEDIAKRSLRYRTENKEAVHESSRKHREKNKDAINERKRNHYHNNKEVSLKRSRQYKLEHREEYRISRQKRRSRNKLLNATLTTAQWEDIKLCFNNKCAYCGNEAELAQDHFVALSKGGEYTFDNILPSCKGCNSSKNDENFFKWYPTQAFYSEIRTENILNHLKNKMLEKFKLLNNLEG